MLFMCYREREVQWVDSSKESPKLDVSILDCVRRDLSRDYIVRSKNVKVESGRNVSRKGALGKISDQSLGSRYFFCLQEFS
jgi:hypothetical protein